MKQQVLTVDADYIKRTLFYYCELAARVSSTQLLIDDSGFLPTPVIKNNKDRFKKIYNQEKSKIQKKIIPLISGNHPSDLHRLNSQMMVIEKKIGHYRRHLDDLFKEALERNNENNELLKTIGKWSARTKFVANSAATVVGLFVKGSASIVISLAGAFGNDLISSTNDPNKASIVAWKGSSLVFIDKTRSGGLNLLAKKGGLTIGESAQVALAKPAAMLSLFFAWDEFEKDMKKFE